MGDLGQTLKTCLDYKIVANIPYYITGQVIRKFLSAENQPESMTLLLQKEVAERLVARDDDDCGDDRTNRCFFFHII